MLTARDLLKEELQSARETFKGTTGNINPDHLHKDPGGLALPLGAVYAHAVTSEDFIMSMIMAKPPLIASDYKEKSGIDLPLPAMDEHWESANREWAKKVRIHFGEIRVYAKAVFSVTDGYVASLEDADLEKEIDMGTWGEETIILSSC